MQGPPSTSMMLSKTWHDDGTLKEKCYYKNGEATKIEL